MNPNPILAPAMLSESYRVLPAAPDNYITNPPHTVY